MLKVDLGARLKELRETMGYSQMELSRRSGVTGAAISKIEHGESHPSLRLILSLLAVFDVSIDEFVSMDKNPKIDMYKKFYLEFCDILKLDDKDRLLLKKLISRLLES